jgi:hypothetical protein
MERRKRVKFVAGYQTVVFEEAEGEINTVAEGIQP